MGELIQIDDRELKRNAPNNKLKRFYITFTQAVKGYVACWTPFHACFDVSSECKT